MHKDLTANYFASKQFFPTVSAYAELDTMRLRRSLKLLNFVFLQAPKTLVTTIKPQIMSCLSFILLQAVNGQAIDRHLLGLKLAALESRMNLHELFMDSSYQYALHYKVSTSQVIIKAMFTQVLLHSLSHILTYVFVRLRSYPTLTPLHKYSFTRSFSSLNCERKQLKNNGRSKLVCPTSTGAGRALQPSPNRMSLKDTYVCMKIEIRLRYFVCMSSG